MTISLYQSLLTAKQNGDKKFVVLIDPDKARMHNLDLTIKLAVKAKVDYFFIGGSLLVDDRMEACLQHIKSSCNIPTILFPGNRFQINSKADAILFLSLISGRNPELLIGNHVIAAPYLKKSKMETISTGYMLIDGGVPTTASYMSNTHPIPYTKDEVGVCTALAGELLGLKMIYMDAGSGAQTPISESMIKAVSNAIDIPLIIGGGIRTPEKAMKNIQAGADILVVGNAIEKDPSLIIEMADAVHSSKTFVKESNKL